MSTSKKPDDESANLSTEASSPSMPTWNIKGMTPEQFKAIGSQITRELVGNLNRNVRAKKSDPDPIEPSSGLSQKARMHWTAKGMTEAQLKAWGDLLNKGMIANLNANFCRDNPDRPMIAGSPEMLALGDRLARLMVESIKQSAAPDRPEK